MSDAQLPPYVAQPVDDATGCTGPRRTRSLHARSAPLGSPRCQLSALDALDLRALPYGGDFDRTLAASTGGELRAQEIEVFQINVGKLCNMSCRHCHVDAGPDRWDAVMSLETAEHCLQSLDQTGAHTVDITGGAPELNPGF
ncbi:MAG: hypothetical protein MI702_06715, partial [Chlorobiales bacterium]|nr:hypothetical protein [Chlorobiales bacterium]